jgi:hypothetical protein
VSETQPHASTATLRPHPISLEQACDRLALDHLVIADCHGIDRRDYTLLRSLYHDAAPLPADLRKAPLTLRRYTITARTNIDMRSIDAYHQRIFASRPRRAPRDVRVGVKH